MNIKSDGLNAAATEVKKNKEPVRERNFTSASFYYLPRRYKTLAKPYMVACKTAGQAPLQNCSTVFIQPAQAGASSFPRNGRAQLSSSLLSASFLLFSFLLFPYSYSPQNSKLVLNLLKVLTLFKSN